MFSNDMHLEAVLVEDGAWYRKANETPDMDATTVRSSKENWEKKLMMVDRLMIVAFFLRRQTEKKNVDALGKESTFRVFFGFE